MKISSVETMAQLPIVLNFSGNDSAGLAGIATDIRTQQAMGVHCASVITANTAQNNREVLTINPVLGDAFQSQLQAVAGLPIKAVKVGLLAAEEQLSLLQQLVQTRRIPLVLDTVLASSSGANFSSVKMIESLKKLLSVTTLVTPNVHEAEQLTGVAISSCEDITTAADQLLRYGAQAVFIKGGHFKTEQNNVKDYFTDGLKSFWLSQVKVNTSNSRGTGCALASAIASALALGYSLYDAVVIGKMAITQGLRQAYSVEEGYGPVSVTHFPREMRDLPQLSNQPYIEQEHFPECNQPQLGLYPVVDRAHWISTLARVGVSTLQLRVKDLEGKALEDEILTAIAEAEKYQCRLFINDYWQQAIKYKAYGVHLGQEDLDTADIQAIHQAGLRLGISTHCHYEVARAHTYKPSYIACGPVYHTNTKEMPWVPHGIEGLQYWRDVLEYPLVAIGGINQQRFATVAGTGVDSIAMITAITQAKDPAATSQAFVQQLAEVT